MNQTLVERIRQCPNLPSLPSIAMEVLDLAQREEVDIAEIARVISRDPALSGKILKTVNSTFYGRSQSVSAVSHALVILGLQSVKTLVLGFSLVTNLTRNRNKGFQHLHYWRRSIYAATAARSVARKIGVVQQEECFLAALLMDIGMLVLDQVLAEQYSQIVERSVGHEGLAVVERAELDMNHAEVGALLVGQWKLPPVLTTPIGHHDDPTAVADPSLRKLTEVAFLASRCADVFVDAEAAEAICDVRRVCRTYGMSGEDCDEMLDEIGKRTREVAPLFEIPMGEGGQYEAILKEANEALLDLTLRTQQQASTLQQQNQQLQQKAMTDALTGLANRARLDEFLCEKLAACRAQGKSLSLLIMDLDRFKSINDQHGHQAGDEVLRWVGRVLKTVSRAEDLAARYGGEEMALVLVDVPRSSAANLAETICRAIAAKPVRCTSSLLPVTTSIGVATFEPGGPLKEVAHLMRAADMAVYAAKHAGRNCVRVFSIPAKRAA